MDKKEIEAAVSIDAKRLRAEAREKEDAMSPAERALAMRLQNIALTGRFDQERLTGPLDEEGRAGPLYVDMAALIARDRENGFALIEAIKTCCLPPGQEALLLAVKVPPEFGAAVVDPAVARMREKVDGAMKSLSDEIADAAQGRGIRPETLLSALAEAQMVEAAGWLYIAWLTLFGQHPDLAELTLFAQAAVAKQATELDKEERPVQ